MNRIITPQQQVVRCAIYTRKSTDEGLEQEFNSLDAQRESAEAYITSQLHEGWQAIPDSYDDGGFTGGNMDRPALKRMLADIAAGKIDCVVVYKVDRLSRSLTDFSKILETFDRFQVAFVSVTQQFNTASSMGRLILNVLLSFAQFEREIISERTRDKIAAARRKGKWSGGLPVLGYDVDPQRTRLVINEEEARQVREIFSLYLRHASLLAVLQELDERGWVSKRWTTKKGTKRGGDPFTKTSLYKILTNITYTGKLRFREEVYQGEHPAIITEETWRQTQSLLQRNGKTGGAEARNKFGALLKGLLHCVPCGCAMTPTHSTRGDGKKRYRYYVCTQAQKRGWHKCPSKSVPAGEIEQFVVEQIRKLARDPVLVRETVAQARQQLQSEIDTIQTELTGITKDHAAWGDEVRTLLAHVRAGDEQSPVLERMADLQERLRTGERRASELRSELKARQAKLIDEQQVAQALELFDPVWESLTTREQVRVVALLVERVDYDGARGKLSVTFHPQGLQRFAETFAQQETA